MSINPAPETPKSWRMHTHKCGLHSLVTQAVPGDLFAPVLARCFHVRVARAVKKFCLTDRKHQLGPLLLVSCTDVLLSLAILFGLQILNSPSRFPVHPEDLLPFCSLKCEHKHVGGCQERGTLCLSQLPPLPAWGREWRWTCSICSVSMWAGRKQRASTL